MFFCSDFFPSPLLRWPEAALHPFSHLPGGIKLKGWAKHFKRSSIQPEAAIFVCCSTLSSQQQVQRLLPPTDSRELQVAGTVRQPDKPRDVFQNQQNPKTSFQCLAGGSWAGFLLAVW